MNQLPDTPPANDVLPPAARVSRTANGTHPRQALFRFLHTAPITMRRVAILTSHGLSRKETARRLGLTEEQVTRLLTALRTVIAA